MYAITEAVRKLRQYLLKCRFDIYTDQKNLKGLLSQTVQTPAQQRWLTNLLGYDFTIHYTPGRDNKVADALSRHPSPPLFLLSAVSSTIPALFEKLRDYYANHLAGQSLVSRLTMNASSLLQYSARHSLMLFKGRLFIPDYHGLRHTLLQEFHVTVIGGHSGVQGTYSRLPPPSSGQRCCMISRNLLANVPLAMSPNTPPNGSRGLYSPCLFLAGFGKTSPWISSLTYLRPAARLSSGLWWTVCLSTPIS
ncbi:UNVERIFIED_CONTAM: hypothetical protein Slati_2107100 [Sesamum latifolium]|uniref:Reverse transcriptase RNase H-like domain-containing protein n=1 Tax=Sesamum latifolium TaxID=2727402 RepID=A0AAW2WPX9_9LAMI